MTDLARTYGGSLYELAAEEKLGGRILAELDACAKIFAENPEYIKLLSTPSVTKEERRNAVDESLGGSVHPYVAGFLKLLVDRGAVREFADCARAYRERYNEDNGILEVTAYTAVELKPETRKRLVEKLARVFGKKIELRAVVDPSLLGGMRLECGGRRIDGTVKDRLDRIGRGLRETVL